jgi:hypothetical protein
MSNAREQKAITILAIEHTLLKISSSTLENIYSRLHKEYNCTMSECYEHPEYLAKVLRDHFGSSYNKVIRDVSTYLEEFTYQRPIVEFLEKIR